ncbi:EamA family transporter RarD [Phenylobacterium montanum]|uniref:EamA family transporter RarD n=1 Tax=Phenylobacterium montanum TaxID=2823693 RepID=A0A975FW47_9CAUL|nr:EamA family transporter RarD [Caulobacter sp. S6]QUD86563.1 EamA family transporter RarD [Caulobacter sp. S6]
MSQPSAPAPARGALIAGIACYTLWGVLPLYLRAVAQAGASPLEIIAHRAAWSAPWAGALVLLAGQRRQVAQVFATPRTLGLLTLSALLIAGNWGLFVWAVANGHIMESSLGYYINPLLNMAMGAVLFRERLDLFGKTAIGLAAAGVLVQGVALGHPPMISLALAFSFGFYGLIRKQVAAEAQTGLFVECLVLLVPAVGYIAWLQTHGAGHFFASPGMTALLAFAGPATVVPLALFAWAARRLPLSTVGFLQFIGPTMQFIIGAEGGERLTPVMVASFSLIWLGVLVFVTGAWRASRRVEWREA